PGSLEDITITNIVAKDAILPCLIVGIPDRAVKHVTISNVTIEFGQASTDAMKKMDLNVPECIPDYPEASAFKPLPAWGCYCRHVEDLLLAGVSMRQRKHDPRTGVVLDDVRNAIIDLKLAWNANDETQLVATRPSAWFHQTRNATIRGCDVLGMPQAFKISGKSSKNLQFLTGVVKLKSTCLQLDKDVDEKEITVK
nr:hypothetical protein [Candidatus Sigynarchaeota archaeon]